MSENLMFLALFLIVGSCFVSAKPNETKNETLVAVEKKNETISEKITEQCLAIARANVTAKDQCDPFKECCHEKCPKKEDSVWQITTTWCNDDSDNKLINGTASCTCPVDVDTSGISGFFAKLGLIFKIIFLIIFLSVLACIGCCIYLLYIK